MKTITTRLSPELTREVTVFRRKFVDLPKKIVTQEQYQSIHSAFAEAKDIVRRVKAWYAEHKKPIADDLKTWQTEEKAVLSEPESWISSANNIISVYALEAEHAAEKERLRTQHKLDKEAEAARKAEVRALKKDDPDAAVILAQTALVIPTASVVSAAKSNGESFRKDYELTVVDINAVPDEYITKTFRLADAKRAVIASAGTLRIPGVTIKERRTALV